MCAAWERRAPRRDRYSITTQKSALCCQNKFCFGWLLPGAQIKLLSTSVKYPWVLNIYEWRWTKTIASGSVNPAWILRQSWLSYSWLLSLFPSEKHNYIPSFPPMHFKITLHGRFMIGWGSQSTALLHFQRGMEVPWAVSEDTVYLGLDTGASPNEKHWRGNKLPDETPKRRSRGMWLKVSRGKQQLGTADWLGMQEASGTQETGRWLGESPGGSDEL